MLANFEYYKVFYFCARYQSITTAASKLCLSQPAVTKTIKNLETTLGCKLFFRSKKGVSLTPKGQILYNKICPACELIFSAETDLDAANAQVSGTIRIAACETACRLWLIPRLQRFHNMYPKVHVEIHYLPSLSVMRQNGASDPSFDFAVVNTPAVVTEDLECTNLADIEDTFVCGRAFRQLAEREISLDELREYPLVLMPAGSSTRRWIDAHFARHNIQLQPAFEMATLSLIKHSIMENLGVGTVPYEVAREEIADGTLYRIRLTDPLPGRKICLITSREHPLGVAANTFLSAFSADRQ